MRNWLSFRLLRPLWMEHGDHTARAISTVVPALVDHLRSADPARGRWQFQRLDDRLGLTLGIRFHSNTEVLDELERRLKIVSAEHDWPMALEPSRQAATRDVHTAERLSSAGSDLALELLRTGELPADDQFSFAVLHIRRLIELVRRQDRLEFLFLYWRQRAQGSAPARRIELATQADRLRERPLQTADELLRRRLFGEHWNRYETSVRELTERASQTVPMNFLLFEHAHLTHNRLGIPVTVEAIAANVVRAALHAQQEGRMT